MIRAVKSILSAALAVAVHLAIIFGTYYVLTAYLIPWLVVRRLT